MHSSNHIIKFADDTTVVGLISKNGESAYREELNRLTAWCKANNLFLNVYKTKVMVVDFRRAQWRHSPLFIDRSSVEIVKSTEFLGVHLVENFTLSLNTSSISKKAQQHLYFLHRLRKAHLPDRVLQRDHRECPEQLHHCLVLGLHHMYTTRCICKANSIVGDSTHPSHSSPSCCLEREVQTVEEEITVLLSEAVYNLLL
ncbi:hypothetical protein QTP70_000848 [Hemibagrus guttatus]|uniref:Alkylated DNA repair protein AlkB homologue 8 N-terminal domain-containing protein n=1 Tax=Hemibagrus guttatus TaxID=175788 RepID=A0AAE0RH13_9TELE|nr:hypothetical protein QTP70_000848 [Hemibagrus guttatus]